MTELSFYTYLYLYILNWVFCIFVIEWKFVYFKQDLLHTCLKVIIADVPVPPTESGISAGVKSTSSSSFNSSIVKLSARLLYTHPKEYDLKINFRRYVRHTDPIKVDRFLVHWLLPLAIRMGTGRFGMVT